MHPIDRAMVAFIAAVLIGSLVMAVVVWARQ